MPHARSPVFFIFLVGFCLLIPAAAQEQRFHALSADVAAVVKGNNEFAFDLYRQLGKKAKPDENIFFSPYSISTALAMTYAGARGQTADEMAKVLHFSEGQTRTHPAFAELSRHLQSEDRSNTFELHLANALWRQAGLPLRADFSQLISRNYAGALREVDFASNSETARRIINDWAKKQTKDRVTDVVGSADLAANTQLVVANAIFFQAQWDTQFSKQATKPAPFWSTATKPKTVAMMNMKGCSSRYMSELEFELLELPYKGGRFSMLVFLPRKRTLGDFEKSLTLARFESAISNLKTGYGDVSFPRFSASTHVRLRSELVELGMPTAFSAGADFSGMMERGALPIRNVIHKAYVKVDEEGTEAAAVTLSVQDSMFYPPFSFKADCPFFFLIHDRQTKSILFLGRVIHPEEVVVAKS